MTRTLGTLCLNCNAMSERDILATVLSKPAKTTQQKFMWSMPERHSVIQALARHRPDNGCDIIFLMSP